MASKSKSSDTTEVNLAPLALDAAVLNGIVSAMFSEKTMGVNLDIQSLVLELDSQVEQMRGCEKSRREAILLAQVLTLSTIFTEMSRRAAMNMNDHVNATEVYMRMALKAQNQVRLTLETIYNMRIPPVLIAKQANISTGSQQVNNLMVESREPGFENLPNQLSGAVHELHKNK